MPPSNPQLRNLDLNLLRIFDAVMLDRNVSRAAERLFLSQPAVSHALARLRHAVGDELFVKTTHGVRPTPRAMELAEPVNQALAALESALNPPQFDPATSSRVFRIATHDYFTAVIAAALAKRLTDEAPGISVRLKPTEGRAVEMLDQQEADFAVSAFGELPERFQRLALFEDKYVCVMRQGHPLTKGRLTIKRFADARHLLISPRGDERGFADTVLATLGHTRQIAMIVNQFASAAEIIAHSDMILTVPERIADRAVATFGCVTRPCPIDPPDAFNHTSVVWHGRFGRHPAMEWFVQTLVQVCA